LRQKQERRKDGAPELNGLRVRAIPPLRQEEERRKDGAPELKGVRVRAIAPLRRKQECRKDGVPELKGARVRAIPPLRQKQERRKDGAPSVHWFADFSSRERNKKIPLVKSFRPWVRARLDAVEIPLNRIKKSKKARNKSFRLVFVIFRVSTLNVQKPLPRSLEMQQRLPVAQSYLGNAGRITNRPESEPRRPLMKP
jgi:hypothetical protein